MKTGWRGVCISEAERDTVPASWMLHAIRLMFEMARLRFAILRRPTLLIDLRVTPMQTLLVRQALALVALMAVLELIDREQRAAAEVRLSLVGGQHVTADQIGPETDARVLAARVERAGIVMTRKIPWSKILAVQFDEQPFDVRDLQARYADKMAPPAHAPSAGRQDHPEPRPETIAGRIDPISPAWHPGMPGNRPFWPAPDPCFVPQLLPWVGGPTGFAGIPVESRVIGVRRDPISAYADAAARRFPYGIPVSEAGFAADLLRAETAAETLAPFAVPALVPIGAPPVLSVPPSSADAVHSIDVQARAASSQGNIDWDVLDISVAALNESGQAVPVRGTLQATLWGRTQRLVPVYDQQFFREPGRLRRVAEWTRSVDSNGGQPTVLTVPFPTSLSGDDESLFPLAALHVRLLVPGRGRFDATQEAILVRPVSPLRDEAWRATGSPFLPRELTLGGRNVSAPVRYRTPSALRPESRILTVKP